MKKIVVFASGSGTNFQSIIDAVNCGDISAKITGLITNKENIGAIDRAKKNAIPFHVIPPEEYPNKKDFASALLYHLKDWNADLIVLAGYLKKIPSEVISVYPNRILNIHPALLPKFGGKGYYGMKVHRAVLESGDPETGCTIHVVTDEFDEGPILAQATVRVNPDDSPEILAKRVLAKEHMLYPIVIQKHLENLPESSAQNQKT